MTCPRCHREPSACACPAGHAPLLPPLPEWRYELQQRVDAYRTRRPSASPRVVPFPANPRAPRPAESSAAREPLAEPVVAPPRSQPAAAAAPAPVWEPMPSLGAATSAVRVPEPAPEVELAGVVARPQLLRRPPKELAWGPRPDAAGAPAVLQLPLPMWTPAAAAPVAAPCPAASRRLRVEAACADAAVVGLGAGVFALACWLSLGTPAPDFNAWRHWLPAAVAVPGLLAALYLLGCAYLGGTTLGMRCCGLRVVSWEGEPVAGAQLRRGWASVVSLAALGLGYAWVFCDSQQLAWHDYISRTLVAEVPRDAGMGREREA